MFVDQNTQQLSLLLLVSFSENQVKMGKFSCFFVMLFASHYTVPVLSFFQSVVGGYDFLAQVEDIVGQAARNTPPTLLPWFSHFS